MSSSDLLKEFASSSSARNEDGTKRTFFTSTATTIHDKITKVVHGEVLRRANDVDTYLAPLLVNELNEGIKCVETSNKLSVTSKDIIRTAPSTSTITTNSPTFTKVSK